MSEKQNETRRTEPAAAAAGLTVPDGDVLVRYVGLPAEGINPIVGGIRKGRIYTVTLAEAAVLCGGPGARFEPAIPSDRTRIEAASKAPPKPASAKN